MARLILSLTDNHKEREWGQERGGLFLIICGPIRMLRLSQRVSVLPLRQRRHDSHKQARQITAEPNH